MSRSRSRSVTTSASAVDTQNLNLQDIEGVAVAGVRGPVSIELSDQGAIKAGRDIALAGMNTFRDNIELTGDVLRTGRRQTETVLEFGADVLRTGRRQTEGVLDIGRDIAFAGIGAFEENVQLTRDILQAGRRQSETAAGLAGSVLARESTNVDPRLENITKFALIGAAVVVAVLIFKG